MKASYPVHRVIPYRRQMVGYRDTVYSNPLTPPIHARFETGSITQAGEVTLGASPEDWRKRVALGYSATSYLLGWKVRFHYDTLNGEAVVGNNVYTLFYHGFFGNGSLIYGTKGEPVMSRSIENKAAAATIGSFVKQTQKWNGGAFIAEIGGLRGVLTGDLNALAARCLELIKDVHRIMKRHGTKYVTLQLMARLRDLWLTWNLAAAPLASDIATAAAAIDGLIQGSADVSTLVRFKGTAKETTLVFAEKRSLAVAPAAQFVVQHKKCELRYTGAARPSARSVGLMYFGLGAGDVIPALWEFTWMSFVVDYFTNCQEILDSSRWWWVDVTWCERGAKELWLTRATPASALRNLGYTSVSISGGGWVSESSRVIRHSSGLPFPTLEFEFPGPKQIATVSALVSTVSDILRSRDSH